MTARRRRSQPRSAGSTRAASSRRGRRAPGTARRRRRWWLALLVVPAVLVGAAGLLAFYLVVSTVPLPADIDARSSVVYDVHGNEVGGLAPETAREDVAISELPPHVIDAVLAAEDRSFREHRGISFTGILRALFTNVRAGSVQQGGSTITQQYIKNAALTPEQTYTRKVEEAALAIKMEQAYEKDEILGFYLNTIYWGRGTHGIEAAARTYFDVRARELDVNQAATLAGMIAAPEAFDPLEHPDRADARRRYVLGGMLAEAMITPAEHDVLVAEGLPPVTERRSIDRGPNAYYLDAVRRELTARPEFAGGALFRGLRIHTELDQRMQAAAQDVLARAIGEGPTDTGAIVSVDPQTGGVRALVGGPDADTQPFNTALRSVRQVGSTFKPFTLAAFVAAGYSPDSRFPAPAELEIGNDRIRNYGGASFGEQTVRQATASSTNTVFVQMQETVGREAVLAAAHRAGLPRDKTEEVFRTERGDGLTMHPAFPGLTLGQDGFSPLELTSAYATLAADGYHVRPRLVTRIEDTEGRAVYTPGPRDEQAMDLEVVRTVTEVLRGAVTAGSGTAAALDDRPVAGKTGTTNEARDVWFAGYVPQLATTVWLGNLDNSPIDAEAPTGGALAAPVWREFMAIATAGMAVRDFVPPLSDEFEVLGEEPEACPEGYAFADPPGEADEDGFFPDILVDITDADGRPCVETKPELEACPDGYAYADPPTAPDGFGRYPDVLFDGPFDFLGRPCVEVLSPEPEPEPDPGDDPDPPPDDDPDPPPDDDPDPPPGDDTDPLPVPDPGELTEELGD